MARFINSNKSVQVALSDLSVNDPIRSGEVDKTGLFEARGIDLLCNNLTAKPVAVVVTK